MRLTLLEILEATGGGEVGGTQVGNTYSTFHTDSREVKPGGVFFALRGAETDGHRFISDSISRGATCVVAQRRMEIPSGIAEVLVPDTWTAFYSLASRVLDRVRPLVVSVTGSNGKTSTKEMVAALPPDGLAVLNADSEFFPLLAHLTSARIATFGDDNGDYRVWGYRVLPEGGSQFSIKGVVVKLAMEGRHQAVNAAAALAACEFAGVPLPVGAAALADVAVEHRLEEITTPAGYTVVGDAYNASPESMLAAFEALLVTSDRDRLLAVLGGMRELRVLAEEC